MKAQSRIRPVETDIGRLSQSLDAVHHQDYERDHEGERDEHRHPGGKLGLKRQHRPDDMLGHVILHIGMLPHVPAPRVKQYTTSSR